MHLGMMSLCIWHQQGASNMLHVWVYLERGVMKDRWQQPRTYLLCKPPHLLCCEQMNPENCALLLMCSNENSTEDARADIKVCLKDIRNHVHHS